MQKQIIIDELQAVCNKHNIYLVGVCRDTGQFAEILIATPDETAWIGVSDRLTNRAYSPRGNETYVNGIGGENVHPNLPPLP